MPGLIRIPLIEIRVDKGPVWFGGTGAERTTANLHNILHLTLSDYCYSQDSPTNLRSLR